MMAEEFCPQIFVGGDRVLLLERRENFMSQRVQRARTGMRPSILRIAKSVSSFTPVKYGKSSILWKGLNKI
jgi:hypothetical protein